MSAGLLALLLALGPAAPAGVRSADESSGTLEFQATQAGARFTGRFERFEVELALDPAAPAGARLFVAVETASVNTRDRDRDEILRSPEFFHAQKHPRATFRSTGIARDDSGWRATGELTIRGVTRTVPVRFTLEPAGDGTLMKGSAALRRLDFGLGRGEFATTEWVGDEVDVRFELRLRPGPP